MQLLKPAEKKRTPILTQMRQLLSYRIYVLIVLGYGSWNFTVGGFSVWGPDFMEEYFSIDPSTASIIFGAIIVVNGVAANVAGSLMLDNHIEKHQTATTKLELLHYKTKIACGYMTIGISLALVFCVTCVLIQNFIGFVVFASLGVFFLLYEVGPLGVAVM
jgi:hypothetical protein